MYAKKIQIINYGPIDHIDIDLHFNGENPKPVLLVGENGSGKSIVLSHIVNGLMAMQSTVYPENSEVQENKVFKLLSPMYIKSGSEYSYGRVNYEKLLYVSDGCLRHMKNHFSNRPDGLDQIGISQDIWDSWTESQNNWGDNNLLDKQQDIEQLFRENCILYFPANRFEEPAWLNEENLNAKAQYMKMKHLQGYTDRTIINYSSLHDNQNWFFEVLFDSRVFDNNVGNSVEIHGFVLYILRQIFPHFSLGNEPLKFAIGKRQNRQIALVRDSKTLVPNIFQLSTGETSLLNIFLSILRDFDLCRATFTKLEDVRGIVVIDEIDLHLHAIHQAEILPKLIKMFPRVQFIITTHSPLFVLGMRETFGQDNFAIYRMPQGEPIGPEEFSEFDNAYKVFAETRKFSQDMQKAIDNAQKPIVFVEGTTDIKHLQKAAELLGRKQVIEKVELKDGGGSGNLDNMWRNLKTELAEIAPQKVIFLHDCERSNAPDRKGRAHNCKIPKQGSYPIQKGIENLFPKTTLEKAIEHKPAFIDIVGAHTKTERGVSKDAPEEWTVNEYEKTNLCDWLCENGTAEDFEHFQEVFNMLEAILADGEPTKH